MSSPFKTFFSTAAEASSFCYTVFQASRLSLQ